MLASRGQENAVHARQTTAAGKPLNRHDENNPGTFGRTGGKQLGKGNENILQMAPSKLDRSAFVTPLGPRTRAPLGNKTTNAKGKALQTPGTKLQQTLKPEKTSKKASTARKAKIVVAPEPAQTNLLEQDLDDDYPDVEYCPPNPVPLPDPVEDFGYDDTFPALQGKNLYGGINDAYGEPRDAFGETLSSKREDELVREAELEFERKFKQEWERDGDSLFGRLSDPDAEVERMIKQGPKKAVKERSAVDTIRSRDAARALSKPSNPKISSTATKPTASFLQKAKKKPAFSVLGSNKASMPSQANHSPMRHQVAVAASRTTVGYSKGRSVSSVLPQKQPNGEVHEKDQSQIHPVTFQELYGEPPAESEMWYRLKAHERLTKGTDQDSETLAADIFGTDFFLEDDEDEELFQLPMPVEV